MLMMTGRRALMAVWFIGVLPCPLILTNMNIYFSNKFFALSQPQEFKLDRKVSCQKEKCYTVKEIIFASFALGEGTEMCIPNVSVSPAESC